MSLKYMKIHVFLDFVSMSLCPSGHLQRIVISPTPPEGASANWFEEVQSISTTTSGVAAPPEGARGVPASCRPPADETTPLLGAWRPLPGSEGKGTMGANRHGVGAPSACCRFEPPKASSKHGEGSSDAGQ